MGVVLERIYSSITTGPSTSSHRKDGYEGELTKLLTDVIHSSGDIRIEPVDKVKMEFRIYLSDVVTDLFDANDSLDSIQWWKLNAARYPCVSVLARKYLAISATSVPSETGHLVNEKRAALFARNSKQ